jgi:hypothetical protein
VRLLYYITTHGYGHAVRASVICNSLPKGAEIIIRTTVPRLFFNNEVSRPFAYEPAAFDCGCVQLDGITVDKTKTLEAYSACAERNRVLLEAEVAWCASKEIDVVVSDIVPFAFEVAKKAAIPSVAATNFTWQTIYAEYAPLYPDFAPYLSEIERQYAMADLALALYPANDMGYFANSMHVGPVGRIGINVRQRFQETYGVSAEKKIGLIYTGTFGMDALPWKQLEKVDEWEFFGLYPLPGSPSNYRCISKKDFRYQDCIASADVMISKLGYGACAECFMNGLPLIYLPRAEFAEFPVLEDAVEKWGRGYLLSKDDFYALRWRDALESVAKRERPAPVASDGARECALAIEGLYHAGI